MRAAFAKLLRGLWWFIVFCWTVVRFSLDLTGRASVVENLGADKDIWLKALSWLFTTPWWVPAGIIAVITVAIYWPDAFRKLWQLQSSNSAKSFASNAASMPSMQNIKVDTGGYMPAMTPPLDISLSMFLRPSGGQ